MGFGVLPPVAPGVGLSLIRRPLDARREVPDDSVEPDIDALVRVLLVAWHRDWDAPVQVARDRPRLELLYEVAREVPDVRTPVLMLVDPGGQLLGETRQV